MPWVRIDDDFGDCPKIVSAGPLAAILQIRAVCYASKHLSDGFIPASVVPSLLHGFDRVRICRKPALAIDWPSYMIDARLWEARDGGYYVHDYLDYNSSREYVKEMRAKKQAAGLAGAKASAKARAKARVEHVVIPLVQLKTYPHPNPTSTSTSESEQNPAGGASGDCIEADQTTPEKAEPEEAPIPQIPPSPPAIARESKALKTTLTDAQAARAKLVCESLEKAPQKSPRFSPWPCLQRMVSGGLEPDSAIEILRRLRDRWDQVVSPWAYVQAVLDKEHVKLAIKLQLEEHERIKREPVVIGGILAQMAERGRKSREPP